MDERRLLILQQVERGDIPVEEGSRLLGLLDQSLPAALPDGWEAESPRVEEPPVEDIPRVEATVPGADQDLERWRRWRFVPFAVMLALTVIASLWITQGFSNDHYGLGFWLSWFPFIIGIVGMVLTFRMRWLHLRIHDPNGAKPTRLNLHIPLPLGIAGWAVRSFGSHGPLQDQQQQAQLLNFLNTASKDREPIQIQVDDRDGSKVEIIID
jgi:hypothetical protein